MALIPRAEHYGVADLPGASLVVAGLDALHALAQGNCDEFAPEALLVAVGARRLRAAGLEVPDAPGWPKHPELALYNALAETHADAHSRYNALIRRLVSFERALEARHRRASRQSSPTSLRIES